MVNPYTTARGGLDAMEGLGWSRGQGGGVETAPAADRAVTGLSFMEGVGRKANDALGESLRDVTRGPAETPGPCGQTGPLPCEGGLAPQNNGFERQLTALQAQYLEAITALDLKQKELEAQKTTLDHTCREVIKTNNALSVLARNIDRRREELAENIARAVSTKILPVVNEMRGCKLPARIRSRLDVLTALLSDLTPEGAKAHGVIAALSPTELRLALMIRKGFSSERIAVLLHTSPHTVKTHRRNIRKKLGLQNSKVNLSAFLKLKASNGPSSYASQVAWPHNQREAGRKPESIL